MYVHYETNYKESTNCMTSIDIRTQIRNRLGTVLGNSKGPSEKTDRKSLARQAVSDHIDTKKWGPALASAKAMANVGEHDVPDVLTPELESGYTTEDILSRYRTQAAWAWSMANRMRGQRYPNDEASMGYHLCLPHILTEELEDDYSPEYLLARYRRESSFISAVARRLQANKRS